MFQEKVQERGNKSLLECAKREAKRVASRACVLARSLERSSRAVATRASWNVLQAKVRGVESGACWKLKKSRA